jgi:4'-phosphopantetheinyl transferase
MEIKKGEIHIWKFTNYIIDVAAINQSVLSEDEKTKAARFIRPQDALKYITNHIFRRNILAKYLDKNPSDISYNFQHHGKPYIPNTLLTFNHTYRNNYGLLAIANNTQVGVDIEYIKTLQDPKTFAAFSFSEQEKAIIFANGNLNQEAFFTFWTFKEAFIKATGTGLNVDISKINLANFLHQDTNPMADYDNQSFTIKKLAAPEGYLSAYASMGKPLVCTEFDFTTHLF